MQLLNRLSGTWVKTRLRKARQTPKVKARMLSLCLHVLAFGYNRHRGNFVHMRVCVLPASSPSSRDASVCIVAK